jgi:hypothetical protein
VTAKSLDLDDDNWQDWQVNISCTKLNDYPDYRGSRLRPLTKVAVTYAQPVHKTQVLYEELTYATSRAIGCRRLVNPIGITPGTAGIIKVVNTPPVEGYAAANAILRTWLDVSQNKCMLKYVYVPHASFTTIIQALCDQGMRRDATDDDAVLSLEIISDTNDISQVLVR